MTSPRLALFSLEALPNARAVRRFLDDHAADIVFVGLSNAERPSAGGLFGQIWRHVRRSGPAILPYLAINFGIPDVGRALYPLSRKMRRVPIPAAAIPLKTLCEKHGIPTLKINDVNGAEVAEALRRYRPDMIIAFHFDQIFSIETLALVPLGGLNVHPGLLPNHRGPVPTMHALAENQPNFGVTVHRLAAQIDTGYILAQESVALPPGTSASGAAILLHERGRILLDGVLSAIAKEGMPEGRIAPVLPYCPFPSRALLGDLWRKGRRLTNVHDLLDALRLTTFGKC
jgi:folate-dependent phosphoribosylglycinamide formyltransferase PurN